MKKLLYIIVKFFLRENVLEEQTVPSVDLRAQMVQKAKDTLAYLRQFNKSDFEGHSMENNPTHSEFKFNYNYLRSLIRNYSISNTELSLETNELDNLDGIAIL